MLHEYTSVWTNSDQSAAVCTQTVILLPWEHSATQYLHVWVIALSTYDRSRWCLSDLTHLIWNKSPPSPLGSHSSPPKDRLPSDWPVATRDKTKKTTWAREPQRSQSSTSGAETRAWLNVCMIMITSPLFLSERFIDFCRFAFANMAACQTVPWPKEMNDRWLTVSRQEGMSRQWLMHFCTKMYSKSHDRQTGTHSWLNHK